MARRRRRSVRILLPGEKEGRRGFLKKGILGAALLAAAGGGAWLATRRTRPRPPSGKPLKVFDATHAAVLAALGERLVPDHPGFPRPADVHLVARADAVADMAHPAAQKELRQLVWLFESATFGLLDGSPRLFTESSGAEQDRRIHAWATSRIAVRRTGYRALKQLLASAYYSAPETWAAVGYPGPPSRTAAPAQRREPEPPAEPSPPPPRPRRYQPSPVAPAGLEPGADPLVPGSARGP